MERGSAGPVDVEFDSPFPVNWFLTQETKWYLWLKHAATGKKEFAYNSSPYISFLEKVKIKSKNLYKIFTGCD